ncbi:hypothetical protein O3P69_018107 [Scylla paramamosain]|uniref:Uncharacterized protein n=1 Tax=Scylla paramamosain TaxID=85552 RepID=A0AAW0TIR4_SCYPA
MKQERKKTTDMRHRREDYTVADHESGDTEHAQDRRAVRQQAANRSSFPTFLESRWSSFCERLPPHCTVLVFTEDMTSSSLLGHESCRSRPSPSSS